MATPESPRPTPESFLDAARAEEASLRSGRLKIFLGASPGVGKTYAMLEEARVRARAGVDVVVALVEDEATVKHFHPKGTVIELRPANSSMQPMVYPAAQVMLQGVVVALQRSLN